MNHSVFRGNLVLPDQILEDGCLVTSDGLIDYVGPWDACPVEEQKAVKHVKGGWIAPGYIDIHVHGGENADYMDGTTEAVRIANRIHARHGTTTLFPTTTTGTPDQLDRMLHTCLSVQENHQISDGARIGGVHYYGPFFAQDKVGCHSVDGRRDPDPGEYMRCFDLGIIQVATCAAELPGAEAFYREASQRGYLVTCGHSNATWNEMAHAFEAGMRHVDHFWCAMSSISGIREQYGFPMQGSMEQFVLMEPEMSTEVIADGEHLSPELLEFAYRMIGPDRLCLVTDANRAMGMPPGKYRFGPKDEGAWFESDGKVGFVSRKSLASSVVGMDTMVRNMYENTSAEIHEAIRMATLTPAEQVGMDDEIGSLEVGKRADLILLDPTLEVADTFVEGMNFHSQTKE
ncbi:MAG TPA: N-acetylglucosamine-6-phosphate deacetylase [Verrucomicrobiales bacterium]|nr:N-acetylglucosamine-6-phosphate deacetylase [Verrucomicrobiales bacterium]